jgi:hypothetical protein
MRLHSWPPVNTSHTHNCVPATAMQKVRSLGLQCTPQHTHNHPQHAPASLPMSCRGTLTSGLTRRPPHLAPHPPASLPMSCLSPLSAHSALPRTTGMLSPSNLHGGGGQQQQQQQQVSRAMWWQQCKPEGGGGRVDSSTWPQRAAAAAAYSTQFNPRGG